MPAQYPAEADLKTFLAATGLMANPPTGNAALLDFANALQGSIDEWERRTGRIRSGAAAARLFDPPANRYGFLIPDQPFATPTAISYQGAALAATDYFLLPHEAPQNGLPYRYIQFAHRWMAPTLWGDIGKISITAVWGAGATVLSAVWMAVLQGAALVLAPQMLTAQHGGRTRWTQEGVTEEFSPQTLKAYTDGWQSAYERAIKVWGRPSLIY